MTTNSGYHERNRELLGHKQKSKIPQLTEKQSQHDEKTEVDIAGERPKKYEVILIESPCDLQQEQDCS